MKSSLMEKKKQESVGENIEHIKDKTTDNYLPIPNASQINSKKPKISDNSENSDDDEDVDNFNLSNFKNLIGDKSLKDDLTCSSDEESGESYSWFNKDIMAGTKQWNNAKKESENLKSKATNVDSTPDDAKMSEKAKSSAPNVSSNLASFANAFKSLPSDGARTFKINSTSKPTLKPTSNLENKADNVTKQQESLKTHDKDFILPTQLSNSGRRIKKPLKFLEGAELDELDVNPGIINPKLSSSNSVKNSAVTLKRSLGASTSAKILKLDTKHCVLKSISSPPSQSKINKLTMSNNKIEKYNRKVVQLNTTAPQHPSSQSTTGLLKANPGKIITLATANLSPRTKTQLMALKNPTLVSHNIRSIEGFNSTAQLVIPVVNRQSHVISSTIDETLPSTTKWGTTSKP